MRKQKGDDNFSHFSDDGRKTHHSRPETIDQNHIAALPESMIEELERLANKRNVPYLALVRVFLSDRIAQEQIFPNSKKKQM
jgi:hypothetical protein